METKYTRNHNQQYPQSHAVPNRQQTAHLKYKSVIDIGLHFASASDPPSSCGYCAHSLPTPVYLVKRKTAIRIMSVCALFWDTHSNRTICGNAVVGDTEFSLAGKNGTKTKLCNRSQRWNRSSFCFGYCVLVYQFSSSFREKTHTLPIGQGFWWISSAFFTIGIFLVRLMYHFDLIGTSYI